jgi:hypothetical protein
MARGESIDDFLEGSLASPQLVIAFLEMAKA